MTAKFSLSEKNRTRLWLIYFAVLFFWGLNACFYLGKTYAKGEMFAYEIDKHPYVSDFINSYSAGVLCSRCLKDRDNPPDIYNFKVQADLQNELIAPIKPENPFYNQYPPVMFLFFLPLSLLSMGQAWIAYCVFAFLLNAALLYYLVLPAYKTVQEKVFLITAIFSSYPFWFAFRLGQPALLLMPIVLVFFHCLKSGNMLLAGLASSLVLLKLQYLPVVVAIGFGAGRLRYLAGFTGGALVLMLLSGLAVGFKNLVNYPLALFSGEAGRSTTGVAPEMMQNLRGCLVLLSGQDSRAIHITAVAVCLTTALALFIIWFQYTRKKDQSKEPDKFNLLSAASLLTMLITSVHTHIQDYVLAVRAFEMTYQASRSHKTFLTYLALFFPLISWPLAMLLQFIQIAKIQPLAIYALIAVIALILEMKKRKAAKETAPSA